MLPWPFDSDGHYMLTSFPIIVSIESNAFSMVEVCSSLILPTLNKIVPEATQVKHIDITSLCCQEILRYFQSYAAQSAAYRIAFDWHKIL